MEDTVLKCITFTLIASVVILIVHVLCSAIHVHEYFYGTSVPCTLINSTTQYISLFIARATNPLHVVIFMKLAHNTQLHKTDPAEALLYFRLNSILSKWSDQKIHLSNISTTTVNSRLLHIFRQHHICAITGVCAIIEVFEISLIDPLHVFSSSISKINNIQNLARACPVFCYVPVR